MKRRCVVGTNSVGPDIPHTHTHTHTHAHTHTCRHQQSAPEGSEGGRGACTANPVRVESLGHMAQAEVWQCAGSDRAHARGEGREEGVAMCGRIPREGSMSTSGTKTLTA